MLNELAKEIHENAVAHGWWETERTFGEIIALCHSELSEALEEYRDGNPAYYFICTLGGESNKDECDDVENDFCFKSSSGKTCITAKPEGIAVELADCIIRILDYCGKENIDIDTIIRIKHEYNKTRPHRHGGKII